MNRTNKTSHPVMTKVMAPSKKEAELRYRTSWRMPHLGGMNLPFCEGPLVVYSWLGFLNMFHMSMKKPSANLTGICSSCVAVNVPPNHSTNWSINQAHITMKGNTHTFLFIYWFVCFTKQYRYGDKKPRLHERNHRNVVRKKPRRLSDDIRNASCPELGVLGCMDGNTAWKDTVRLFTQPRHGVHLRARMELGVHVSVARPQHSDGREA